jgi:broad specificity phosphatase PhoE
VETVGEFTEIDIGIFAGLTLEQARERHPDRYRAFMQESWEGVPGAERIDALYARALAAWQAMFQRHAQGRRCVLAVTHSGFLQWIIRSTLGLAGWMPLFNAGGNCCVSHMLVDNQPLDGGGRSRYANWMLVNASVIPPSR